MAEMEMNDKKRKDDDAFVCYILLKDKVAQKGEKGHKSGTIKFQTLLAGEVAIRKLKKPMDKNTGLLELHLFEKRSYSFTCLHIEVKQIDEEEAKLLLSLSTMVERLNLYEDNLLKDAKKMTLGSIVYVKLHSRSRELFKGIVRYKGPLDNDVCTWFGVELLEGAGRGTTNGYFKGKQYFKCDPECGVFVSFEKLRMCKDLMKINNESESNGKEEDFSNENNTGVLAKVKNKLSEWSNFVTGEPTHQNSLGKRDKSAEQKFNEGDRVWVYINDDNKPHGGHIRFIGRFPAVSGIHAGIEMDNAVGLGDGNYYDKQLFTCAMDHAHFAPIETVIPNEKLPDLCDRPSDGGLRPKDGNSDNPPPVPQSSEDIVNMESKCFKKDKDQVIKEQEELFKKIREDGEQKITEKRNLDRNKKPINGTGFDEQWKPSSQSDHNNHISQATIQMNQSFLRDQRYPNSSMNRPAMASVPLQSSLDVGSMVEVLSKHQAPKYGVIRWLGFIPSSDKKIAGLELEEELDACTDGTFTGKRYFTCPNRRGFFVHLHNCLPDSRFTRNSMENAADKRLTGTDFGPYKSPIIEDDIIPPSESLDIYLKDGARGIQGHHNSCYLDSTLFAIFAFSSIMDSILLRPKSHQDIKQYNEVQRVLRDNIISPLRANGFVRADRVLELRRLLDRLGTVTGLVGEEKDPEEFLLTLLQQVLKSEPFLKIKSATKEVRHEYFYQVLADKDVERVLPSVEELLKRSFHQSDLKLTEVPSCLIVQMPRFGKGFKMYNRILPSLTINIGELVDNSPQDCAVCGRLAKHHCRDCFTVTGSEDTDSSGNFCQDCNTRVHSHVKRNKHNQKPIAVSREICNSYSNDKAVEHREMELFAIICIETSHYVTFAKCDDLDGGDARWCFFDSMADRIGTKNGYNVPSVKECPEIIEWLSSEKQNRERIINTDDKELPDRVRRILGDAYVCLYESKEMAMYK